MRLRPFDRAVGLVLASFIVLLALENLAIGIGYRAQFVGTWEMNHARIYLTPIALALALPIAIAPAAIAGSAHARSVFSVERLFWATCIGMVSIEVGFAKLPRRSPRPKDSKRPTDPCNFKLFGMFWTRVLPQASDPIAPSASRFA